ncbi:uncharacterized protein LOC144178940 isoform X1 [Haemaphysalis longicornis]
MASAMANQDVPLHRVRGLVSGVNWRVTKFAAAVPPLLSCGLCRVISQTTFLLPCFHNLCDSCLSNCAKNVNPVCPFDELQFAVRECHEISSPPDAIAKLKALPPPSAYSTPAATKGVSHSAMLLEQKQTVLQSNLPTPSAGVAAPPFPSDPHPLPMGDCNQRSGSGGPEAALRAGNSSGRLNERGPPLSAACSAMKALQPASACSTSAITNGVSRSAMPPGQKQKVLHSNLPTPSAGVPGPPYPSHPHLLQMGDSGVRAGSEGPEAALRAGSFSGRLTESASPLSAICSALKALQPASACSTSAATNVVSRSSMPQEQKQKVLHSNLPTPSAGVPGPPYPSHPHQLRMGDGGERSRSGGPEVARYSGNSSGLLTEQCPPLSAICSALKTSQPKMADCGPYSQLQGELESRLNKLYEERDIVKTVLQQWIEKADALASHVSNVGGDGRFAGPYIGGFVTLDRMFTRLFQVYALLSQADNVPDPPLPKVAPNVMAQPSSHKGAEAPPQDSSSSCLSLNAPSVAPPPVSYEAPGFHSSDSAVRPGLKQNKSLATGLPQPASAKGRGTPARR